ncbi:MAG: hypothetical protein IJ419_07335 [Agathobacter sp.]|nr:hypothetical protein [Agathobacter sp.]
MKTNSGIQLNNAQQVLNNLQECSSSLEQHLTMVEAQGSGNEPVITDSNIHNNSKFVLDLWD